MPLEVLLPRLAIPVLLLAWWLAFRRGPAPFIPLLFLAAGLVAWGLGLRWERLGHGPFFNLYEILASSLFSLTLVLALFLGRRSDLRASARAALPVPLLLGGWLWATGAGDSHFHPTYDTAWLWVHLAAGKLFLGILLCALGVALLAPLRGLFPARFADAPHAASLERPTWALLRWALLFDTAMLVAGAVWAQGAWGRYWAWDPLESWAFLTWLALVTALHTRRTYRVPPGWAAGMVAGAFCLAFLTFFGVPFLSMAPHKGVL